MIFGHAEGFSRLSRHNSVKMVRTVASRIDKLCRSFSSKSSSFFLVTLATKAFTEDTDPGRDPVLPCFPSLRILLLIFFLKSTTRATVSQVQRQSSGIFCQASLESTSIKIKGHDFSSVRTAATQVKNKQLQYASRLATLLKGT